jgi:hypothetical protein
MKHCSDGSVQYTDDGTALYHDQDSGILACEIPATNKLKNKVTEFFTSK